MKKFTQTKTTNNRSLNSTANRSPLTNSAWSYKTAPVFFPTAVATNQGWCNPVTGEILVAISQLDVKNADGIAVPTFTLAVPADGDYITGQVLTFTLTASEAVTVTGSPSLTVTIGSTAQRAEFNSTLSTGTVLRFDYTVTALDIDANGIVVGNTLNFTETGKGKNKVIDNITGTTGVAVSPVTFTVPVTTGITVNGV